MSMYVDATMRERGDVMFHTIGETAGEIWRLLESEGPLSTSALANMIKRPQAIVHMGIGWLAREGKLGFTETKRGMSISAKK
jgi:predicted transcriptional regulator